MPDLITSYLLVTPVTGRQVTGTSRVDGHNEEIEVISWHWGASAGSALASGAAGSTGVYRPLVVIKKLDRATTQLFNALEQKRPLASVRLTLRANLDGGRDVFTITLTKSRLTDIGLDRQIDGVVYERLTFGQLGKINLSYVDSQGGASSTLPFEVSLAGD